MKVKVESQSHSCWAEAVKQGHKKGNGQGETHEAKIAFEPLPNSFQNWELTLKALRNLRS